MATAEKALAERVREMRRRHFGPRGKAEFARRLDVPLEEYERFERGTVPPGEVMLRMCEVTGEDLQWLLTGVASRGTVVISGARRRHQDLIARVVQLLDDKPELAAPVEAFIDLLVRGEQAAARGSEALPAAEAQELIPIFECDELPDELPGADGGPGGLYLLPVPRPDPALGERQTAELIEPAATANGSPSHTVAVVSAQTGDGGVRRFVQSGEVARCFPGIFGVRLGDSAMEPMFKTGDAVLVAAEQGPTIGRPTLCKFAGERAVRCRIWLGEDEHTVHLGRLSDGEHETVARDRLRWSVEVLYRLSPAA